MYEDQTADVIRARILSRVDPELDTREGSIIDTSVSPAAIEIQGVYIDLDVTRNETFAGKSSRDGLIKRAAERGIYPIDAKKAVLKGVFTPDSIEMSVGERFSLGTLNYSVLSKVSAGVYRFECEIAGAIGNRYLGAIVPVGYINGLKTATLTEVLIPGEDEEETEVLRARYQASFKAQAFGGNVADYREKVNLLQGVGGVKITPCANGPGTVGLTIISSLFGVPSVELIAMVQTVIDPVGHSGQGVGLAPIGAVVTVYGVIGETVDIATTITYENGWDYTATKPYIEAAIDGYFLELAESWEGSTGLIVRVSQIETRLLDLAGVLDIAGTTLNGVAANLAVGSYKIPARGVFVG